MKNLSNAINKVKDNGILLECEFTRDMTDQEIQEYFEVKQSVLSENGLGYCMSSGNNIDILFDIDFCKENDIDMTDYDGLELLI